MVWLPFLEDRHAFRIAAQRRISFLDTFATQAPLLFPTVELAAEFPQAPQIEGAELREMPTPIQPSALPAINALMQAGEIALATDETQLGLELLGRALDKIEELPPTHWPTTRAALLGALLNRFETTLSQDGITFAGVRTPLPWRASAAVYDRVAGPLVAAALASHSPFAAMAILAEPPPREMEAAYLAFLAVGKAPESDMLPAFGVIRSRGRTLARQPDEADIPEISAFIAFFAMHQRYASRLRLLEADGLRWLQARPRVSILDLPLLILHLGLLRRLARDMNYVSLLNPYFRPVIESRDALSELIRFLYELAMEITSSTGSPDSSGGGPPSRGPQGPSQKKSTTHEFRANQKANFLQR